MHRDFKIGLVVGLVLLIIAMGWIAGHESLSTDARLAREQSSPAAPGDTAPAEDPRARVVAPPAVDPAEVGRRRDRPGDQLLVLSGYGYVGDQRPGNALLVFELESEDE